MAAPGITRHGRVSASRGRHGIGCPSITWVAVDHTVPYAYLRPSLRREINIICHGRTFEALQSIHCEDICRFLSRVSVVRIFPFGRSTPNRHITQRRTVSVQYLDFRYFRGSRWLIIVSFRYVDGFRYTLLTDH